MNLWVRSQNKENIIPIKNPICVYDNKIIYKESASYIITIAEYKTKERAIEVLDEIQNILKPKYILDTSSIKPDGDFYEENGVIFQNYDANAKIEELSTFVYQMPAE